MKRKDIFYSILALCFAALAQGCSSDEELVDLVGIRTTAETFELDEAGNAVIEFIAMPNNAEVYDVSASLNRGQGISVTGLKPLGKGYWQAHVQVTDWEKFEKSQQGTLMVNQTGGVPTQFPFTLTDPFAITEEIVTVSHPFTVSYCDAEKHHAMKMPIILSSKGMNVDDITDIKLVVTGTSPRTPENAFVFEGEEGEYSLSMDQGFINEIIAANNPPKYYDVIGRLVVTMKNGRWGYLPFQAVFAQHQITYQYPGLTFQASDIATAGYQTELIADDSKTSDIGWAWHHIGFMDEWNPFTPFGGTMELEDCGLYRTDGTRVDDGAFFTARPNLTEGDHITICGNAGYDYEPGTYHRVYRAKTDWEHNGKKYERVHAEFRYEVILK